MIPLTEAELLWARRESATPERPLDERLRHLGLVAWPGAYGRGCLTLLAIGSAQLLCSFCQGTVRRAVAS